MKRLVITLLTTLLATALFSQPNDTISYKRVLGGYKFYQAGEILTLEKMEAVIIGNRMAEEYISNAKTVQSIGMTTGYLGGLFVGLPLAIGLANSQGNDYTFPNIALGIMSIGMVAMIGGHIVSRQASRDAIKAVNIYNSNLHPKGSRSTLSFGVTNNGVGLCLRF